MQITVSKPAAACFEGSWKRPGAGGEVSGRGGVAGGFAVEGDRPRLEPVDVLLVTEADVEGDDLDAVALDEVVGQVAGAVGDDADGHGGVRLLGRTVALGPPGWRNVTSWRRPGRRRRARRRRPAAASSAATRPQARRTFAEVAGPPEREEQAGTHRQHEADPGDGGGAHREARRDTSTISSGEVMVMRSGNVPELRARTSTSSEVTVLRAGAR